MVKREHSRLDFIFGGKQQTPRSWDTRVIGLSSSLVVGLGIAFVLYSTGLSTSLSVMGGFMFLLVVSSLFSVIARLQEADQSSSENLKAAAERIEVSDLESLLKFNQAELEEYSRQTRRQARYSFWASVVTITFGLGVLIGGSVIAIERAGTTDKVAVSALAAIGTLLSGYISRTFLWVYERALAQLNFYFQQPVVTGYFLNAERLADKGTNKEARMEEIIRRYLDTGTAISKHASELLSPPAPRRGLRRQKTEDKENVE